MNASLDILAVADALEQSGMDTRQAHACATQMHLVAHAREAVTRPEVEAFVNTLRAEIAKAKAELGTQIVALGARIDAQTADLKNEHDSQIAAVSARLDSQSADFKNELGTQIAAASAEFGAQTADLQSEHGTQITAVSAEFGAQVGQLRAEMAAMELRLEKRMVSLFWRLFGGVVALMSLFASIVLAAIRYLPPAVGG